MQLLQRTNHNDKDQFDQKFAAGVNLLKHPINPLNQLMAERFLKTPFPKPHEFWLLEANDRSVPLALLSANVSLTNQDIGYLGFFDMDLSLPQSELIGRELLQQGISWLRTQGVKEVLGPIQFSTWFPYRLQTKPHPVTSFAWEPQNPLAYNSIFKNVGFKTKARYHSHGFRGLEKVCEITQPIYEKAIHQGFQIREFDSHRLQDEIKILHRITLKSFSQNFLFEPIGLEQFTHLYVPMAQKSDMSYAHFAVDPTGNEVGYFFCFLDQNYLVLKSVGLLPEARGHGLSHALTYHAFNKAKQQGIEQFVTALVKEGAASESKIEAMYHQLCQFQFSHEYELYSFIPS